MADTFAAIATPLGEGGVGIVRVSGPGSLNIMKSVFKECPDKVAPRHVYYGHALDTSGNVIDEMICIYMRTSYIYRRGCCGISGSRQQCIVEAHSYECYLSRCKNCRSR